MIYFFLLSALIAAMRPPAAFADGMIVEEPAIREHKDKLQWDLHTEGDQQAYILYSGGREKLLISVGLGDASGTPLLWIFPVPSAPEQISVDVSAALPDIHGEDVHRKARTNLENAVDWLRQGQLQVHLSKLLKTLYPDSLVFFGMGSLSAEAGESSPNTQDVLVYSKIEKEGIAIEVLTAKTSEGLNAYLRKKGLIVSRDAIPVFDRYIGKDYSFVLSRIGKADKPGLHRAVVASFPASEMFYPLLPTSVYGDRAIPTVIRAVGHVTPRIIPSLKSSVQVNYFLGENLGKDESGQGFYSPTGTVKYTKIDIHAPSNLFTDDLWIMRKTPLSASYHTLLVQHPIILMAVLAAVNSLVAGILVGAWLFPGRRNRMGLIWLALIGLANCLTSLGLWLAILGARTLELSPEQKAVVAQRRSEGSIRRAALLNWAYQALDKRKLIYIPLYSIVFLMLLEFCDMWLAAR